ncbi:hypothetical protein LOTGIDRAFT_231728 [Lottia gigantea]|uniref:Uncharacterized protein n=1 Tax=Lottia gigantea TaxID=225164 RepID=V4AT95_LOTGI|nr:hypothetical protein LOTGIDRAFT_231728 [Lottia gigantea]ESO96941.1 hypothetical protein LOTGIDRAFT_231728 [Lottia gigantea]
MAANKLLLSGVLWYMVQLSLQAGTPNLSICDPQDFANRAKKQQAISQPVLPEAFSVRIECNIVSSKQTIDMKQYYDGPNDRGTIVMYENGTVIHLIFDYANDEMLSIVDDLEGQPDCTALPLSSSPFQFLFGLKKFQNGSERISSPQSAFKFGGDIPEVFMGREVIRGINCDVWESCIYWDIDNATIHTQYYFSTSEWIDSVAKQDPVRAHVVGSSTNSTTTRKFEHYYDFTDYFEKILGDPTDIFETPHMAYCPGRNSKKSLPSIPDAFSFSSEIQDPNAFTLNYIKEYYDFNMHLFRYDFYPDANGPYGTNKLTRIHDFNTGVAYIIDSLLGNCTTTTIDASGLDAEATIGGGVRIRTKEEFFDLDGVDLQYVGLKKVRDMDCDVYTAQRTDWPPGATIASSWEWSFVSSDWMESVGTQYEFGLPAQFRIMAYDQNFDNLYNIYEYKEDRPMIWSFDISPCYSVDKRKDIQFALPGKFRNIVEPNESLFKEFILLSVIGYVAISPIRVANIEYSYTNDDVLVQFTLLDVAPMGDVTHVKEVTLDEADQLLEALINKGDLIINMDNDTFKDLETLRAKPYSLTSSGVYILGANPQKPTSSGYSSGSMAGLGIGMLIVAFLVGAGIMFLVKKFKAGTIQLPSGFSPKRFDDTEMKTEEGDK